MTEARMSFLYNIAMSHQSGNVTSKKFSSFYLMRSQEITGGYGLPNKLFSNKIRCPHCCVEWGNTLDVKIKPIKLSNKQKRRMLCKGVSNKSDLLQSNILEHTCPFCNHTTTTKSAKPAKEYPKLLQSKLVSNSTESNVMKKQIKPHKSKSLTQAPNAKNKKLNLPKTNTNVYTNAIDVFSLKNKCNTLPSTVKETPKIIKNNKKRKDKFAGLCQKAVLASAKAKQDVGQKKTQNKLSLLLKPSSG